MTLLGFFTMCRSRAGLISGVMLISVVFGMAVFSFQPPLYEVSMLVEVRAKVIGAYDETLPALIKQVVNSGALDKKIASESGLDGAVSLPKLKAGIGFYTQFLKIYAFVPAEQVERTKTVFYSALKVLNKEFPSENNDYFRQIDGLRKELKLFQAERRELELKLERAKLSPVQAKLAGEIVKRSGAIGDLVVSAEKLRHDAQTLNAFNIRMILQPSVADIPAGPSRPQVLIAFGLLGLFIGLTAALWVDGKDPGRKDVAGGRAGF